MAAAKVVASRPTTPTRLMPKRVKTHDEFGLGAVRSPCGWSQAFPTGPPAAYVQTAPTTRWGIPPHGNFGGPCSLSVYQRRFAETELTKERRDIGERPDDHGEHPVRVEVCPRYPRHRLGIDVHDPIDEPCRLVRRQAMPGKRGSGPCNLRGGLEAPRKSSCQRGPRRAQLLVSGGAAVSDRVDLVDDLQDGVGGRGSLDAGAERERTTPHTPVERGAGSIRVALVLAKVQVDSG